MAQIALEAGTQQSGIGLKLLGIASAIMIVPNLLHAQSMADCARVMCGFGYFAEPFFVGLVMLPMTLCVLVGKSGGKFERLAMAAYAATIMAPFLIGAMSEFARANGYFDRVRMQQPDGSWKEMRRESIFPHMSAVKR